jgi:hypothetical protein
MKSAIVLLPLMLAGCADLLPKGNTNVEGPWNSFEEAQQTFDKIIPYHTTVAELKAMKIEPKEANITILSYSDVLQRFVPNSSISVDTLDQGVLDCVSAKSACRGYEIVQRSVKRNRVGNFFSDFLNFRRQVDVTGWSFKGIILMRDGVVVYKLVSGQPLISEREDNTNPLGPLQGAGDAAVRSAF